MMRTVERKSAMKSIKTQLQILAWTCFVGFLPDRFGSIELVRVFLRFLFLVTGMAIERIWLSSPKKAAYFAVFIVIKPSFQLL
jgi:hypothetical protein